MEEEDAQMPDAPHQDELSTELLLSAGERRVLALYDSVKQLQLEIALVRAQQSYLPDPPGTKEASAADITDVQDQVLDAHASYLLRNDVVEAVLAVNPTLKAVHLATHASPVERDLLPLVEHRDAASVAVAAQSSELGEIFDTLARVEAQSVRLSRQNLGLASEVLRLAAEADQRKSSVIMDDPGTEAQLKQLEANVKTSRQKWKVMKGAAGAMVAGTGVDWAKSPELRDLVLDPD